jgi:hypothetical protein
MDESAIRYSQRGNKAVEGWLSPFSARYILKLSELQDENKIAGAAVEIGVHHGRLFILLHLAGSRQRDMAIDVFDDQNLNKDRSGRGNKSIFVENIKRHGGDLNKIEILQKSSLLVTPEEIISRVGKAILFSVDGGHTAECAFSDLRLADAALHDDGVVVLDDFFNEYWPEVCLGASEYLNSPESRLRPFALTPGKMYLCSVERNEFYRREMKRRCALVEFDKEVEMFGAKVQLMGMAESRRPILQKIRRLLSNSPAGPLLKALKSQPSQSPG